MASDNLGKTEVKPFEKSFYRLRRAGLSALWLLVLWLPVTAESRITLDADSLSNGSVVDLNETSWKYRAGDDSAWAAKDFPDDDWKSLTNQQINRDPQLTLDDWHGRAWFRLRVQIDESLVGQPFAVRVWHWGASEIYLDGKLIQRFGRIEVDGDTEFNPRGLFMPIVFADSGIHTVAVRHSFAAAADLGQGRGRWLADGGFTPGFRLIAANAMSEPERLRRIERDDHATYVFVGILLALALVHSLLFAFYPLEKGNLYYSFFVGGLGLAFLLEELPSVSHFTAFASAATIIFRNAVQSAAIMSLLAFLYDQFARRVSTFFWILLALWAVSLGLLIARVSWAFTFELAMLGVTLAECLRVLAFALARRQPGAWNIAVGVAVLVLGVTFNVLFERDLLESTEITRDAVLYLAVLSVPLAVSIYLARNSARTNSDLETKLVEVETLARRALEHEQETARLKIVEAENSRRAKELEEARRLQLSMLPKKLPQIPNLEIAAYMKPATEVGGDYYDFYVAEDGTLTVAVGDATGHGLKAGTVVAATKSLFNAFAGGADIAQILRQSGRALKQMNLRGMFMALLLLKVKDNRLSVAIAGMPPLLVYRAAVHRVEEVSIKAIPLGGLANADYDQRELVLGAGDIVLAMSDGFPEMFNPAGETLGFDQAARILPGVAERPAQEIVNRFVEAGEAWAQGRPPDDDVTFVILKINRAAEN